MPDWVLDLGNRSYGADWYLLKMSELRMHNQTD
jgi:hypothetical protein